MHAIFFGIKRVHLRSLAVTAAIIELSGLTPARFDMLRIVELRPDGVTQSTIRWLLGVSAPTVSRMLKELQRRGFVERRRDARDGRCLRVRLTARGHVSVRMALEATMVDREADRTAARGVTGDTRVASQSPQETNDTIALARAKVEQVGQHLAAMRKAFDDRAPFPVPWRSGPFAPFLFATFVDGQMRYGPEDPYAA